MTPRDTIGVVLKALFGSNPNTEIEAEHTRELTASVHKNIDRYRAETREELKASQSLAVAVSNISKRLG
jgi:hypothetical protein